MNQCQIKDDFFLFPAKKKSCWRKTKIINYCRVLRGIRSQICNKLSHVHYINLK